MLKALEAVQDPRKRRWRDAVPHPRRGGAGVHLVAAHAHGRGMAQGEGGGPRRRTGARRCAHLGAARIAEGG